MLSQIAERLPVRRLREDDPDVREGGLEDADRDVLVLELPSEPLEVVDLHDPVVVGNGGPVFPGWSITSPAASRLRERLVDRAVVAVVVHQDLRTAGDMTRPTDREADSHPSR